MQLNWMGVALALFLTTPTLTAQIEVDTLDVPATSVPRAIAQTGRNVTIVTQAEIQRMPVTTIDEVLRYLPGIEVNTRNGFGAQADLSMRGSTFSQVLILIDGMRLNDPLTAHFNANIPIALSEIERIEVLRGPAAADYGPDAMGGVINIITSTFTVGGATATRANIDLDYGQHNLFRINAGVVQRTENSRLALGFLSNQSDGQYVAPRQVINNSDTTQLQGYYNYFDVKTATASYARQLSRGWQLAARAAYDYRDFAARYFYTSSPFDKSTETTSNLWTQLQLRQVKENQATQIHLAHKYNQDEFVFSPDFPSTNNHTTQFTNLLIHHLHRISPSFDLKAGLQADYRTIVSNDRGNHQDAHVGVFGVGIWRPAQGLQLTTSLRADYDENYGFEVLPQANLNYDLTPTLTLRAAAGRSIRAADYTERYVSFNLLNLTPGRNLGNPDLNAESAWSQELGIDFQPFMGWTLKGTGFLRQGQNLIDYVATQYADIPLNTNLQPGAAYFYATNIAAVQTRGFEVESWMTHYLPHGIDLDWNVGYTFIDTRNDSNVAGAYLTNHARHLVTGQMALRGRRWELNLNGLYKGRNQRTAPAIDAALTERYTVINARAKWFIHDQFALNLMVNNLFDVEYADVLGAPMPRRWLMGGMSWRL